MNLLGRGKNPLPAKFITLKFASLAKGMSKFCKVDFNYYGSIANMNFGMIASESILHGECFSESEELDEIRNTWKQMGIDLPALNSFIIEMNTTATVIKIFFICLPRLRIGL